MRCQLCTIQVATSLRLHFISRDVASPLCSAYRMSLAASRPAVPAHVACDEDDAEQVVRRLLMCHPALACPYPGLALAQPPAQSCAWKRRKQLLPQRSPLS